MQIPAVRYSDTPVCIRNGQPVSAPSAPTSLDTRTVSGRILSRHNHAAPGETGLRLSFDMLVSHDITYVGIIQTARASGMTEFPIPYALTNCHNSLCAVGGTINEDDHVFGLSAAKKYGGIYVPANQSVIHSYAREAMAGCGKMILGSDSHTRYGALGTLGVGEGGPELVKQLLKNTYDIDRPKTVLVWLTGAPRKGIGPHDVALSLVGATFGDGLVRNKVLEFAGPGVSALSMDFRNGIDVMTTETACLTSVWLTDEKTREFLATHSRADDYYPMQPEEGATYDSVLTVNLSEIESMIALPFHPSNVYTIRDFTKNAFEILSAIEKEAAEKFKTASLSLTGKILPDGRVMADQGIIAGCSGGMFESIDEANAILKTGNIGNGHFSLSVYPTSVPVSLELTKIGVTGELLASGAVIKPSFCGPCFGAGDVPANNGLSLRHTTRNFPNREGSKPGEGQLCGVALMDARSIAATAANGGIITPATDVDYEYTPHTYHFDSGVYSKRVYNGFGHPMPDEPLILGPNITDWPIQYALADNVLLELCAVIHDPVTTTDELIPSGETSSYRSNPIRLSEFALSRRVPTYVARSKQVSAYEKERRDGKLSPEIRQALAAVGDADGLAADTEIGSCIFANKPGDGSAREQAASCQRVLGGLANICYEYATKRYRSNCINWGILPFTVSPDTEFPYQDGDRIFVPGIRQAILDGRRQVTGTVIRGNGESSPISLNLPALTDEEREILLCGCLMNYYAAQAKKA